MKDKINDLLIKMQSNENCRLQTRNKLMELFAVEVRKQLKDFVDAYNFEIEQLDIYYHIDNDFLENYLNIQLQIQKDDSKRIL